MKKKTVRPSDVVKSDFLLSSIVESHRDFILFALDRNYCFTTLNSGFRQFMQKIWGTPGEVGANMLESISDPQDHRKAKRNIDRALQGDTFTTAEDYGKAPNRFHYESSYSPLLDEQGRITGVSVFMTDVTEKRNACRELEQVKTKLEDIATRPTVQLEQVNKKLEQELARRREAEKEARKFKKIIQTTAQSVIITSIDGTVLYVNPSYYHWSGFTEQDVVGKPMFQFASPEGAGILQNEIIPTLFSTGQWHGEMTVVRKDGTAVPAELYCSLLRDTRGQPEYFVAVFTDISERKRSVEEINKLSRVVETTSQAIVISKMDGTIVYVNQGLRTLLKNSDPAGFLGKSIFEFTDTEGTAKIKNEILPALLSTGHWRGEINNKRTDGTFFPADEVCSVVTDENGNPEYLVAIFSDISEARKAERALSLSEQKFRNIVEYSQEVIMLTQPDGTIAYLSPACSKVLGHDPGDLVGKQPWIVHPDDLERVKRMHFEALKGKTNSEIEYRIITREKTVRWIHHSFSPVITDRKLQMIVSIIRDITKRIKTNQKLQESEQKYKAISRLQRAISDNMTDMLWAKDLDKKFIFANKAICTNLLDAKTVDEPIGRTDMWFANRERKKHPENPDWHTFGEICQDSDQVIIDTKKPGSFDEYGNVKGKFKFLRVHKSPLIDEEGKMIGIVGSARDVTAEKETQKRLKNSEKEYRQLIENASEAIYIAQDGQLKFVNPMAAHITGFTNEELLSIPFTDLIHPEDRELILQNHLKRINNNHAPDHYEFRIINKSGQVKWLSIRSVLVEWGGKPATLNFSHDITENKQAEEDIHTALMEKNILLNELYHRTKNNMQVISSLLALQSQKIEDPQLLKNNEDMIHRIRAMSLVHQKLYQSQDLSKIHLKEYVEELAVNLMRSYNVNNRKHELKLEIEPIQVLIDIAIPCGLLLNEMLTNAFEHAFPDQHKGVIRIVLKNSKMDRILLKVSDNGVGLPDGLDPRRSDSMGMRLIFGIAEQQLQGSAVVKTARGTHWSIEFDSGQYKRRV